MARWSVRIGATAAIVACGSGQADIIGASGYFYSGGWGGDGTFTMSLPPPGALAAFALLGLRTTRRRR